MKPNEDKIDKTSLSGHNDSTIQSYLILSLKTLYYLLISLSVLAAFISQRFPYSSMKFYYDMQAFDKAIVYAEKSLKINGKRYAQCLHYGIEMSDILLFNATNEKEQRINAKRLEKFTEEFYKSEFFESRCKMMDEYFFKNTSSLIAKIGLFSYKDYVFSKNTAARTILNKAQSLFYDGGFPTSKDGEISDVELVKMFKKIINDEYIPNLNELSIIFNQLSQNILYGGSLIYDQELEEINELYNYLKFCINASVNSGFSYIQEVLKLSYSVEKLYFLNSVAMLAENLKDLFSKISIDSDVDEYFSVLAQDKTIPIYQYYLMLIQNN